MKKIFYFSILLLTLAIAFKIDAQNSIRSNFRTTSLEIGILTSSIKQDLTPKLKNYYGLNLSVSKYIPFNKYLIKNLFSYGINLVWLDANYSQYRLRYSQNYWKDTKDIEVIDLGVAFGPYIKIGLPHKFNFSIYVHYSPSYAVMHNIDIWNGCFESKFVLGGAISYKLISLGVKYKSGVGQLNQIEILEENINKTSTKFSSITYYLSFNF